MKMLLIKIGKNSYMIVIDDPGQVNLPQNQIFALADMLHLLCNVAGVSIVIFSDYDVVCSDRVSRVVRAYRRTSVAVLLEAYRA